MTALAPLAMDAALRVARSVLVTFVVASASWALVGPRPADAGTGLVALAVAEELVPDVAGGSMRAAPLPRGLLSTAAAVPDGDREVTEVVPTPYRVRYQSDPGLFVGEERVLSPGTFGEARETWVVTYRGGVEWVRTLVASTELRTAVDELRADGSRWRPAPPAPAVIDRVIRDAAAKYGADSEQLFRVAWCESRYDPSAYNPRFGDSGLFQFIPTTWAANAPRAGLAGASVFDAEANAAVAAWMFRNGQAWQWTCK